MKKVTSAIFNPSVQHLHYDHRFEYIVTGIASNLLLPQLEANHPNHRHQWPRLCAPCVRHRAHKDNKTIRGLRERSGQPSKLYSIIFSVATSENDIPHCSRQSFANKHPWDLRQGNWTCSPRFCLAPKVVHRDFKLGAKSFVNLACEDLQLQSRSCTRKVADGATQSGV